MFCAIAFLAIRVPAADTNSSSGPTNDLTAASLLQIQEELHTTQLAVQQSQQAASDAASNNAEFLAAQMQTLAQAIAAEHESDVESAHKTLQSIMLVMGVFGLVCLGVMLAMVFLQSRAFTQLNHISSQQQAALSSANAVHQFATPGRAVVENSNAGLLDVVGQLKDRLNKLEKGTQPVLANGPGNGAEGGKEKEGNGHKLSNGSNGQGNGDILAEGQKYIDENAPQKALELFDRFLSGHPDHAEALLKKADALQKIGRNDEALAFYNRVIAKDSTLAVAHLQKGGLLNRLRRYDEALNCYEQALQAQERKRR
ncbi:MAG: tetratricopeptide repeat protein [Verrucomicrobiota bacterium]